MGHEQEEKEAVAEEEEEKVCPLSCHARGARPMARGDDQACWLLNLFSNAKRMPGRVPAPAPCFQRFCLRPSVCLSVSFRLHLRPPPSAPRPPPLSTSVARASSGLIKPRWMKKCNSKRPCGCPCWRRRVMSAPRPCHRRRLPMRQLPAQQADRMLYRQADRSRCFTTLLTRAKPTLLRSQAL